MSPHLLAPRGPRREPSVTELLDDPIMALLLRRDGLRVEEVRQIIAAARKSLDRGRSAA